MKLKSNSEKKSRSVLDRKVSIPIKRPAFLSRLGRLFRNFFGSVLFKIFVALILLCVVGVIVFALLIKQKERDEDSKVVAQMDSQVESIDSAVNVTKIARVGKEYIFQTDLFHYAYEVGKTVESVNHDEAMDNLIEQSLILQDGEKSGTVELTSEIFNNPFKDYVKRTSETRKVVDEYLDKSTGNDSVAFQKWIEQLKKDYKIEEYSD